MLTICSAQVGLNIKSAQNFLKFDTFCIWNMPISIFMSKMIFIKYFPPLGTNWSQNWKCSGLIEIGNIDIWNIPISILMSKIIFIEHLPPVRPKLVPKVKVLRIYWNLRHSKFQICQCRFWCQKCCFIKYLPIVWPQLVPKWKMLRIYWNSADLLFQTCRSQFWCQGWFLLNIYHRLGPNWSKMKGVQNLLKFDTFNISITSISISCQNDFYQILTNC